MDGQIHLEMTAHAVAQSDAAKTDRPDNLINLCAALEEFSKLVDEFPVS